MDNDQRELRQHCRGITIILVHQTYVLDYMFHEAGLYFVFCLHFGLYRRPDLREQSHWLLFAGVTLSKRVHSLCD